MHIQILTTVIIFFKVIQLFNQQYFYNYSSITNYPKTFTYKSIYHWLGLLIFMIWISKGPFREPEEVQKQRYKPFQPSLRVATDFYSLEKARKKMKDEEWVTRLNDNMWVNYLFLFKQLLNYIILLTFRTSLAIRCLWLFRSSFDQEFSQVFSLKLILPCITMISFDQSEKAYAYEFKFFLICFSLQPFTHRFVPYEPLLHTTTKFGHIAYGTKFFREKCVEKFLSPRVSWTKSMLLS